MDKELASFHTYLFSLCVNAAAAQATSAGNRQLKLTRRSWIPAEQYCQVEQASTAPAQTSWQTVLLRLAMNAYWSCALQQIFFTCCVKEYTAPCAENRAS